MSDAPEGQDDARDEAPTGQSEEVVRFWLDQIERYDKAFNDWSMRVEKIWRIYTESRRQDGARGRKLSLLWSNVSTLQPAIYARMPQPTVSRRFKDSDPVARAASELVERSLTYIFDEGDLDSTLCLVRDDYLLGARGQVWVRYEADFEPILDGQGAPVMEPAMDGDQSALDEGGQLLMQPSERIADERVPIDYVHWKDFGHTPARYWQEVTAVWRKTYLTRTQLVKRFGREKAAKVSLDQCRSGSGQYLAESARKATVYEIWDRDTGKVYFIAKACCEPLEVTDPFLKLKGFWPCPKPVYGTLHDESLVPAPDYVFCQDIMEEIDQLTARIGKLTDQLKLVGFYPKGDDNSGAIQIEKALQPGVENKMIGIPSWAAFTEKGGVNAIVYLPVEQVLKVLQGCIQLRKELKSDLFEITGISDIVRGESDPNETAKAQQLKTQWGSIRIRDRQKLLAKFIRDISRIVAEIVSDRFQPETLMAMANMQLPSQAELDEAMAQQEAALAQQQMLQASLPRPGTPGPAQMPPQGGPGMMPPGPPQGAPMQPGAMA